MASTTETNTASNMTSKVTGYFKENFPAMTSKVDYGVERARSIATDVSSDIQKTAANNNVNSFLPSDAASEVQKAVKILNSFTDPEKAEGGLDSVIPKDVIADAKGLAIFTVIKAGFVWSGRVGSGLVVAKLSDGKWSCPSLINIGGLGFGAQLGADVTNFLIVLNSEEAVKAFCRGENLTLGGNLSVSAGPVGFGQEYSGSLYERAPLYSYSKSKGLFAGVSVEGTIIIERKDANKEFYGDDVSVEDLLTGRFKGGRDQNHTLDVLYDSIKKAEERNN
ncbi:5938_t:CDS:2 [Funneliformis geosporum]|uniref:5938_t:CDS:1 n=1 Tax=Funneliformis geosporum TaxID=1117311 RepID=A0A9W4SL55_9GLOM|nr:5938_t:CDS:2 [Funneliformis geosporum]